MTFQDNTRSVIIGGTSGIGQAVAKALAERPGIIETVARSTGLDITDEQSVATYFNELGPVDHVIITAGSAAPSGSVSDVSFDAAKQAFDTKFWGSIAVAKAAAKHIKSGGTITLTSGFLARRTVPGTYVKTAMNAALEATTKILAMELAPIRVNVVSPGMTDTQAYSGMADNARETMLYRAAASLPVGKVGAPQDLAQGYLFVIDNPFVTGAVIDIDGGALIN